MKLFRKTREALVVWLAWKLPRSLVYWAAIRLFTTALPDDAHPDEFKFTDALKVWK